MKVNITKRTRSCILASEMEAAKAVVRSCKEWDEWTAKQYAEMAASLLLDDNSVTVFCADAYVMPNRRVWNQYGNEEDNTGHLDVWIDFSAKSWKTFIEGGCYLTDLWNLNAENRDYIKSRMYCLRYERPN